MALLTPEWNPALRQLRHFAWLAALVLALGSFRASGLDRVILHLAAGCVFASGTIWPGLYLRPYQVLAALTWPLGCVIGHVLLAGIYFGLLTPLGLLLRLGKRDPLQLRPRPGAATYWQPRLPVTDRQRYFRSF